MTEAGESALRGDLASLEVGTDLGLWEVAVREATATRLATGVGRSYTPDAPVTPALAGNLGIGYSFRILPRNILHSAQTIRIAGTVGVGDELHVRGRVARITRRGARAFVTITARVEVRDALVWWIESESYVPGLAAEHLDESTSGFPVASTGNETATDSWTPSRDQMRAFSGPGNFHSDPEIAHSFGYPRPVVQGMHVAARAIAAFPSVATPGRDLHMWFTGLTLEGETLTYSLRGDLDTAGAVVATGPDGDRRMLLTSHPTDETAS